MADNTIALELHGTDFVLDDLGVAVEHFRGLLTDLATDVAEGSGVTWRLGRLGTGSIVAEVRCEADDPVTVDQVISAYERVGAALANGDPVPFSETIVAHTDRLTGLINGRVTSVRFRTARTTHEVRQPAPSTLARQAPHEDSFGAVEGVVETLAWRRGVRFVVYPVDEARGVPCYMSTEDEAKMAQLWRKRVRVEGLVRRDSATGDPLSIRDITNIEVLEPPAAEPEDLWGILPTIGDRKPEEVIQAGWDGA